MINNDAHNVKLIQIQNCPRETHYFLHKGKRYPFNIDLFNLSSNFFSKNPEKIQKDHTVDLIDESSEININLTEKSIVSFIQYVQHQQISLTNENVVALNYLSKKYEIYQLIETTNQYIEEYHKDLILQLLSAQQNEKTFCTDNYEHLISNHLENYINNELMLTLPISIIYRILSEFESKQKQEKTNKLDTEIIDFLFKCLSKHGKNASILFSLFDISKFSSEKLNLLLSDKYSNIFDFHFLNHYHLKSIYDYQNELFRKEEQNKDTLNDFIRKSENEINQLKQDIQQMNEKYMNYQNEQRKAEEENRNSIFQLKKEIEKLNEDSKIQKQKEEEIKRKSDEEVSKFKQEIKSKSDEEITRLKQEIKSKSDEEITRLKQEIKSKSDEEITRLKQEIEQIKKECENYAKAGVNFINKIINFIFLVNNIESLNEEETKILSMFFNKETNLLSNEETAEKLKKIFTMRIDSKNNETYFHNIEIKSIKSSIDDITAKNIELNRKIEYIENKTKEEIQKEINSLESLINNSKDEQFKLFKQNWCQLSSLEEKYNSFKFDIYSIFSDFACNNFRVQSSYTEPGILDLLKSNEIDKFEPPFIASMSSNDIYNIIDPNTKDDFGFGDDGDFFIDFELEEAVNINGFKIHSSDSYFLRSFDIRVDGNTVLSVKDNEQLNGPNKEMILTIEAINGRSVRIIQTGPNWDKGNNFIKIKHFEILTDDEEYRYGVFTTLMERSETKNAHKFPVHITSKHYDFNKFYKLDSNFNICTLDEENSWFQIEFTRGFVVINGFRLKRSPKNKLKNYKIICTDDDKKPIDSWTTLCDVEEEEINENGNLVVYDFDRPSPVTKYVRLVQTGLNWNNKNYLIFFHFDIFGAYI